MLGGERDGVLSNHRLASGRVRRHKHTLAALEVQHRLLLEHVQLEREADGGVRNLRAPVARTHRSLVRHATQMQAYERAARALTNWWKSDTSRRVPTAQLLRAPGCTRGCRLYELASRRERRSETHLRRCAGRGGQPER